MSKYKSAIEKIVVSEATFQNSPEREIEPSWINFFYGNNGSGKTTISRMIRNGQGLTFGNAAQADEFATVVFNRDFIDEELKFDIMPGVVMLSKEASDKQQEIEGKQKEQEQLKGQLQTANDEADAIQKRRDKLKASLDAAIWKAAAKYKKVFGGKGDLSSTARCVQRVCSTAPVERNFDDIKARYEAATDPNATRYDAAPLQLLDLTKLESAETYSLLGQAIISTADNAYSRFWQNLHAMDWVNTGHTHYSENAEGCCPYCKRELPSDFEEQFLACFDEKYSQDCARLGEFGRKYAEYMTATFIEPLRRYIELIPQTGFGDWKAYGEQLKLIENTVQMNNQKIAAKIEKPSEVVELNSIREYVERVNELLAETNKLFEANNKIFDAKGKTCDDCINEAWELLAFETSGDRTAYDAEDKKLSAGSLQKAAAIKKLNGSLGVLKNEIRELSDKMGGTASTVDKINELLQKTGFRGFQLRPHARVPDKYEVVREDGEVAKGLSEGEKNFIAFLYFYFYVQGAWRKEDLVKGKIVVIDDPVSSMDSGVLFVVSSLVRKLVEDCFLDGGQFNIKQIFVLTHNPYFHKEISHKYETSRDDIVKKSSFFFVKKSDDNVSTVRINEMECVTNESGIENVSPVKNSYDALWCEYRDARLPATLLSVIQRIVEYYFLQLCSYSIEDLRERVKTHIGGDDKRQRIADEILRFIYDEKFDAGDGINYAPDHDIPAYKEVFEMIFDALSQKSHYLKMSGECE